MQVVVMRGVRAGAKHRRKELAGPGVNIALEPAERVVFARFDHQNLTV